MFICNCTFKMQWKFFLSRWVGPMRMRGLKLYKSLGWEAKSKERTEHTHTCNFFNKNIYVLPTTSLTPSVKTLPGESILSNQTKISLLEVHLILSLYYNKYNGFAIYTMLCPWLYSSSCKHSHHWKYVCKSQNPHQPHAETDSFMKNGGLIGSLLGSSLSLVRWSSSMLICVQGSKWKRGMMRIVKLRFFIEK